MPAKYQPYDPIATAPQYDWRGGISQRSGIINQMGEDSLNAARQAAMRRAQQQASDQAIALANAGSSERSANQNALRAAGQSANQKGEPYVAGNNKSGSGFGKFMQSIAAQESGGSYGARNAMSGAMGKYQIMPANILGSRRGWDWEVLGRDISPSQFIASPELQEQIASAKLQGYYNKYGPAGAAIAWYAGPGAAQKYVSGGGASTRGEAGGHPSVSGYMQDILRRMGYA